MGATMAVVGLCIGTSMTTAFAAGGAVIPEEVHATAFGFLTFASLSGVAISPVLSGLVAAHSIRAVFISAVVVLLMLALIVRRVMVERNPPIEAAPVVEES
jgi:MFS family permease